MKFDYVIIGGGSAGCVLAGRLSEESGVSVCLIEAGPHDRHWRIRTPVALVNLMRNPRFNWMYQTAPQQQLYGRSLDVPRGRTLGGSSAINSMVYIRGRASDYEEWEGLGCEGWGWDSVLPYFIRSERNLRIDNDLHGRDGPLVVSDLPSPHPLCQKWIEAGESVGIPRNDDFNGETQEGLGIYQVTMNYGRRWSSANAYLGDAGNRGNLTVMTGAEAQTIEFDGARANGVSVQCGGSETTIGVSRELILSAGAIGSPALLLASGVGPADDLRALGINVVNPLPAVGHNLQEHPSIAVSAIASAGRGLSLATLPSIMWSPFQYWISGKGLLSTNHVEAGGFARTDHKLDEPDVQFHMIPARVGVGSKGIVWGRGYYADACLLKPESRGRLTLARGADGLKPMIDLNVLGHERDREGIVAAFRLLRSIMDSEPMQVLGPIEDSPGVDVQSDEQILEHCRQRLGTAYHPVGTCRMGAVEDPNSVVGPDLRVIGLDNVRVCDASVMPEIVAGNTNAPTIMIGEVAADKIRQQK